MHPGVISAYDLVMRRSDEHAAGLALGDTRQAAQDTPALERTTGAGRVRISERGVAELHQQGALRLKPTRGGVQTEIVAINTAGGLTGGDRLDLAMRLDTNAAATFTTTACKKIYRSAGGEATVSTTIHIAPGARLDWLPQPMILFDRARIRRSLALDIAGDASLLAVEGVILGRTAMGEELRSGSVHDAWRVCRDGVLVYADAFRAEGDVRRGLAGRAAIGDARAFATALYVAPDAEARIGTVRDGLQACAGETGASAWNGLLAVRFLAADGGALIADLGRFLSAFRGAPLPRSWSC